MKKLFVLFTIVVIFYSCGCPTYQIFPVPDKVKFDSIQVRYLRQYVVTDTVEPKFIHVSSDTSIVKILNPIFSANVANERVESIDFKDKLKSTIQIYSKGKITKTYDTDFTPYFDGIDFIGTLSGDYLRLYVTSKNSLQIPYYMSFYRKKGQIEPVNNLLRTSIYYNYDEDVYVENQIRSQDLKVDDTIFVNRIDLIYSTY